MRSLLRLLPLLLLTACGTDEGSPAISEVPSADEAELRSAGCDAGQPILLWADIHDANVWPLTGISRFSLSLTREYPSMDAPISELVLTGLDRLPRSVALCGDRGQLGLFMLARATLVAEASDGRVVTADIDELPGEHSPWRSDLHVSDRRVSQR